MFVHHKTMVFDTAHFGIPGQNSLCFLFINYNKNHGRKYKIHNIEGNAEQNACFFTILSIYEL